MSGESRTVELGSPVHYVDFGGAPGGPTVVLVHGLGGSHLNWDLFAPRLAARARVRAVDLPGFGMSAPTGHPATVRSNVSVLARFVRRIAVPPVLLVGNSMGGLVSVLLTAREPDLVRGLVLLDPALPDPGRVAGSPATLARLALHALPGVGERLRAARRRRIGPAATLRETLELCGVPAECLPGSLLERSEALVGRQDDITGMDRAFLSASRSLAWVLVRPRAYRRAMAAIRVPVLLVHGDRDRLVGSAAARRAALEHPGWRFVELPGVGHLPQLQVPGRLAGIVTAWTDESAVLPGPGRT